MDFQFGGNPLERSLLTILCMAFVWAATGCGDSTQPGTDVPMAAGYALRLRGGAYTDGSGRSGLALLATLRDEHGQGPAEAWSATLSDEAGPVVPLFSYEDTAKGSHGAWWWPSAAAVPGRKYTLTLTRADGTAVSAAFQLDVSQVPHLPRVGLSEDGNRLTWEAVPGALGYACRIFSSGQLQHSTLQTSTGCDVSNLPPGSYSAAVLAFSADLSALAQDLKQMPELPAGFSVSEGRLAFARSGTPASTLKLSMAGGALYYGRTQPGLALWLGITQADGNPTPEAWSIEVVGPGLAAGSPLRFTYPPAAHTHLVWSYDAQSLPGHYSVAATSETRSLSGTFTIGEPSTLETATGIVVEPSSSGGATVKWSAVPSAKRYYVSAWARDTSMLVAALWADEPLARFAAGTFLSGSRYDVYVAASDVAALPTTPPDRVTVSENTYFPTSFTAL
jgi:hypothetical protein